MRRGSTSLHRLTVLAAVCAVALFVGVIGVLPAISAGGATHAKARAKVHETTFRLFPNKPFLPCARQPGQTARVTATVTRGRLNDTMKLALSGFKPGLDFDLFTIEKSNQLSDGTPDPAFTNFGLAWYQSDIHVGSTGLANVTIKTILLDQIFGFDPAVGLAPTNTFHAGFWFNNPADAASCGFTGMTPFNGEHNAGPNAFITRPDAEFNLGPLCTDPVSVGVCNP
jgi:hypothetical protein